MKIRKYWMVYLAAVLLIIIAVGQHIASGMHYLPPVKYGQAFTLYFNVYDSNSPWSFYATAPAAADIHVYQDGASMENPTNSVTDLGNTFSLVLSIAEMTAAEVVVEVNDASSPKLYMDDTWIIPTYGNASALGAFDLDDAQMELSTIGDKVVADMDANSLLANWTAARAAILSEINLSAIGDKVQADMDANATSVGADIQAIDGNEAGAAGLAQVFESDFSTDFNDASKMWNVDVYYVIGEDPIGESDVTTAAQTAITNRLSEIGDKVQEDIDANSTGVLAVDPNGAYFMVHGGSVSADVNEAAIATQILATTPSTTATENTVEWILAWIQKWTKRVR